MRGVLFCILGLLASAEVASACTVCDSPSGAQVRAAIFDQAFLKNAAMTLAPFPVFGAIVAWIYFGPLQGANPDRRNEAEP